MPQVCSICNGSADREFRRVQVWANERWRLTTTTYRSVAGLCYLEPKRHISYITELDGREALEFGSVLSGVSRALKETVKSELVYVYIYGGHIPHLHVHLAPHRDGDIFADDIIKEGAVASDEVMEDGELGTIVDGIKHGISL